MHPQLLGEPVAKNARKFIILEGIFVFFGQKERKRTSNTIVGSILERFFDPKIADSYGVWLIFGAFWTFKMPDTKGF